MCTNLDDLIPTLERIAENVRSDHPLQGQTFDKIADALQNIANALHKIADRLPPPCP